MRNSELTNEESEVLSELLQHALAELDIEIGRTDTHEFKEKLKRRRAVMDQFRIKLAAAPAMV